MTLWPGCSNNLCIMNFSSNITRSVSFSPHLVHTTNTLMLMMNSDKCIEMKNDMKAVSVCPVKVRFTSSNCSGVKKSQTLFDIGIKLWSDMLPSCPLSSHLRIAVSQLLNGRNQLQRLWWRSDWTVPHAYFGEFALWYAVYSVAYQSAIKPQVFSTS